MSSNKTNPLGRLHNIISELLKQDSNSPYTAFATAFELDKSNTPEILSIYSELFKLCDDSRKLITNIPNINHEKFLSPINNLILELSKIDFTSSYGLNNFKHGVTDKLLSNLDLCSEMLSYTYNEQQLESSVLIDISNNVESLIKDINTNIINIDPKLILISNLNEIKFSIDKYNLYGISGIKNSMTKAVGSIVINSNLASTENEQSITKKFLKFLNDLNTTVSFTNNVITLVPKIVSLIN